MIVEAAKEVGKPLFFSLLIITVSFLPVFTLEAQEGRLFKPLAFTKTFAMFFASFLSITLVPVLMVLLVRGRIAPERKNPISRLLIWLYRPFAIAALRWRKTVVCWRSSLWPPTWPAFQELGIGVHAAAVGRHDHVHADAAAGGVDRRSPAAHAGAEPHHPDRSRGRDGLRQGGPRPRQPPIRRRSG